jgi:hypothetical protein
MGNGRKLKRSSAQLAPALVVVGLIFAGGRLHGQQRPDVTVQVKVVNVPATVRDKHGKIASDLTKDDFVLEEDGRPQTIHYFSHRSQGRLQQGPVMEMGDVIARLKDQTRRYFPRREEITPSPMIATGPWFC